MARICAITGRRPVKGSIINRKGQSKKSGGIGTHVTSITKRKFRPNLQRIRVRLANGGTKRYPGWYHNLKAQPDVEINIGPKRFPVTARIVLPDDADYARLWQLANKNNADRYTGYQQKTDRPIAVVVLSPR